jgi:hypothetical protein
MNNVVANTLRRLAPYTSLRQCAHRPQNSSIASLNRILESPHRRSHYRRLAAVHRQRRKTAPQNHSPEVQRYSIAIIPVRITATAAPAASFLPPNRKGLRNTLALATLSCQRPFRCRLAVIHARPVGGDRFLGESFQATCSMCSTFSAFPRRLRSSKYRLRILP